MSFDWTAESYAHGVCKRGHIKKVRFICNERYISCEENIYCFNCMVETGCFINAINSAFVQSEVAYMYTKTKNV